MNFFVMILDKFINYINNKIHTNPKENAINDKIQK